MGQFTVEVTANDIAMSSKGEATNALAKALLRMKAALQLPEASTQQAADACLTILVQTNIYNGYDPANTATIVTLSNAIVCGQNYAVDNVASLIVALQNIADIKPSQAFTAILTSR